MAENDAQNQVLGLLENLHQTATNDVDRLRRELEGARNALATAEEFHAGVEKQLAHHKAQGI